MPTFTLDQHLPEFFFDNFKNDIWQPRNSWRFQKWRLKSNNALKSQFFTLSQFWFSISRVSKTTSQRLQEILDLDVDCSQDTHAYLSFHQAPNILGLHEPKSLVVLTVETNQYIETVETDFLKISTISRLLRLNNAEIETLYHVESNRAPQAYMSPSTRSFLTSALVVAICSCKCPRVISITATKVFLERVSLPQNVAFQIAEYFLSFIIGKKIIQFYWLTISALFFI